MTIPANATRRLPHTTTTTISPSTSPAHRCVEEARAEEEPKTDALKNAVGFADTTDAALALEVCIVTVAEL